MTICKIIIRNLYFLFMAFVQNQEITMPEYVGYIIKLTASYFYKGLNYTVLGPTGVNWCMACSLLDR